MSNLEKSLVNSGVWKIFWKMSYFITFYDRPSYFYFLSIDIFVGSRYVLFEYGKSARSESLKVPFIERLSKISVTSKTHKVEDYKSCKLVVLNQKEVALQLHTK